MQTSLIILSTFLSAAAAEPLKSIGDIDKSLVTVGYQLKFYKGRAPVADSKLAGNIDLEKLVRQNRPFETAGFVISDTEVLAPDPMIRSDYIQEIHIDTGDHKMNVTIQGICLNQRGVILRLTKKDDKFKNPLKFSKSNKPPLKCITREIVDGQWVTRVQPVGTAITVTGDNTGFISAPASCLIIDSTGQPLGICLNGRIDINNKWEIPPLKWPIMKTDQLSTMHNVIKELASESIARVSLAFRKPAYSPPESEHRAIINVPGIILTDETILVIASLDPDTTARLNKITVYTSDNKPVEARFKGSLKNTGCLLASPSSKCGKPLAIRYRNLDKIKDELLSALDVRISSNRLIFSCHRQSVDCLIRGMNHKLYPVITTPGRYSFLFDANYKLVAARLSYRAAGQLTHGQLIPIEYLRQSLSSDKGAIDMANAPLPENEENHLAWLGVHFQHMTPRLAAANGVSHLTDEGTFGAIVSCVYPDSIMAKAGIKPGHILLRIKLSGNPVPVNVQIEPRSSSDIGMDFPDLWRFYDKIPDNLYERIPVPWTMAENSVNRMLTNHGYGKKFIAVFYRDGKVAENQFTVTRGPNHFDTTGRFNSPEFGLEVRNMTYETRRYFRMKKNDPGVIVSRVSPGSTASEAGIMPYEIITNVNNRHIMSIESFASEITGAAKARKPVEINIIRWTKKRIVTIDANK